MKYYYSNEIVFRGHPDKVCDQIAAKILQECIGYDRGTRAGIEVCGGKKDIFVAGEITTEFDIEKNLCGIVGEVFKDVGYTGEYEIVNALGRQSPDIARGVDVGGAGDNGMMFGYACRDTLELLPTAMVILQKFAMEYERLRKYHSGILYSDGKAQITGIYEGKKLIGIKDFTICYHNSEEDRDFTDKILEDSARRIADWYGVGIDNIWINPTGKFEVGGFRADAGVTGRKIVVDAYQSFGNVGGGNMNGKDPTKVDFSGAHKARDIAKRVLVEEGLDWCQVQLSYSIGLEEPMAIYIESDRGLIEVENSLYEKCRVRNIIKDLDLLNADFYELAKFGHFRN